MAPCEPDSAILPPDQSNRLIQQSNFTSVGGPWVRLEELDVEAIKLKTTLGDISRERVLLKKRINKLSPILQLPVEITTEIFLFSFPYNLRSWVARSPLFLGRICSRWREIAWSTPHLWCSLSVPRHDRWKGRRDCSIEIDLFQEWIERTKKLPLFLSLKINDPSGDIAGMNKFMDIVVRSSEQWETVAFVLYHFFRDDRCFVPVNFPCLKSLKICIDWEEEGDVIDIFSAAHQLCDVYLDGFWNPATFKLPPPVRPMWITLGSTALDHCLCIFQDNPNCVFFDVEWLLNRRLFQLGGVVVAPQLKTLTVLTEAHEHEFARFLDRLTTPALTEITLVDHDNPFPWAVFVSFIFRSACSSSLATLALTYTTMSVTDFATIFPLTPCLLHLSLYDIKLNVEMLSYLTLRYSNDGQSGFPIPKLLSFTFYGRRCFPFSTLVAFLSSRWHVPTDGLGPSDSIHQLESVHIRDSGQARADDLGMDEPGVRAEIEEFVAKGMEVSIVRLFEDGGKLDLLRDLDHDEY